MNTSITKEQFVSFCNAYKQLARDKQVTAADIVLYNLIRDLPIDRGFTAITNKNKLANGAYPKIGFKNAVWLAKRCLKHKTTPLVKVLDDQCVTSLTTTLSEVK